MVFQIRAYFDRYQSSLPWREALTPPPRESQHATSTPALHLSHPDYAKSTRRPLPKDRTERRRRTGTRRGGDPAKKEDEGTPRATPTTSPLKLSNLARRRPERREKEHPRGRGTPKNQARENSEQKLAYKNPGRSGKLREDRSSTTAHRGPSRDHLTTRET